VFKEEIISRFGPPELIRPFDSFASLKQTTSVKEYLSKFEQVARLLDKLHPVYIIDKFIRGLKKEINYEVLAAKPMFLREAITLAKPYEEKFMSSKKTPRQYYQQSNPTNQQYQSSNTTNLKPDLKQSQYTKLTPTDIVNRRNKDLCYTCDEKWFYGHR